METLLLISILAGIAPLAVTAFLSRDRPPPGVRRVTDRDIDRLADDGARLIRDDFQYVERILREQAWARELERDGLLEPGTLARLLYVQRLEAEAMGRNPAEVDRIAEHLGRSDWPWS